MENNIPLLRTGYLQADALLPYSILHCSSIENTWPGNLVARVAYLTDNGAVEFISLDKHEAVVLNADKLTCNAD